ncbi:MAG: glycosyl transferase family 90 [Myxococcaceae bacterium]
MFQKKTRIICLFVFLAGCNHSFEQVGNYHLPYEFQIEHDLKPFKDLNLHRSQIKKAYLNNPKHLAYVRILKNGEVTIETKSLPFVLSSRVEAVVKLVEQSIHRFGPLPEMEFIYNLEDEPQVKKNSDSLVPVFSFSSTAEYADVTFPMIGSGDFYRMDDVLKDIKAKAIPFEKKKDLLVWRGSQTGGEYNELNWTEFPRSKLVLFCQKRADLCDAGFSAYSQVTPGGKKAIEETVGLKKSISMENMQAYKYIASLDGNTWPDRFPRLIASNSLVFKENSKHYSFFDLALKPGVHYVSLKNDMSDLEEKILWAKHHPKEVEEIIQNANQFADQYLSQASVEAYVYKLLLKYSELFIS